MLILRKGNGIEIVQGMGLSRDVRFIFDPPYGNGAYETDKELPPDFYRWLIDNFQTVAFFGYPEKLIALCVRIQVIPIEWITWHPTNKVAGRSNDYLPKETECIAVFGDMSNPDKITRKRANSTIGKKLSLQRGLSQTLSRLGDVWNDASPGMSFNHHLRQHPNEKPVSLMTKLVTLCSNEGDTVVDPTMGSGTTGVAALQLGRSFIGCELVDEHFETAESRVKSAALQPVMSSCLPTLRGSDGGDSPASQAFTSPEMFPVSEGVRQSVRRRTR
jgi:site-specific DNA-methyltransferase (adenine-specific)